MTSRHLDWPFLEPRHKALAAKLELWAARVLRDEPQAHSVAAVDQTCRNLVQKLGHGGWLKYAIGGVSYGASADAIDARAVCLIRTLEIVRCHANCLCLGFSVNRLVQCHIPFLMQHFFGHGVGKGRTEGEFGGQRRRGRQEFFRCAQAIEKAPALRFVTSHAATGKQ